MSQLLFLTDTLAKAESMRVWLGSSFALEVIHSSRISDAVPDDDLLVDISLTNDIMFFRIRNWLNLRRRDRKLIFLVDRSSPIELIRSSELDATHICHRPPDRNCIFDALLGDFGSLASDVSNPPLKSCQGVGPTLNALESMFRSSRQGLALDLPAINSASDIVIETVRGMGLEEWLNIVRRHHSQTYQHSLIVVGVTAAFCGRLGFSNTEQSRIALAAMFHDIGKVYLPISVLEKPSALDEGEWAEMRRHPRYGYETLRLVSGIHKDILEVVLHHHELLDGSGYPDGLASNGIGNSVRIVTICDIFAALIERRLYRKAISGDEALGKMRKMGAKLDQAILREFAFASDLRLVA